MGRVPRPCLELPPDLELSGWRGATETPTYIPDLPPTAYGPGRTRTPYRGVAFCSLLPADPSEMVGVFLALGRHPHTTSPRPWCPNTRWGIPVP